MRKGVSVLDICDEIFLDSKIFINNFKNGELRTTIFRKKSKKVIYDTEFLFLPMSIYFKEFFFGPNSNFYDLLFSLKRIFD